MPKCMYHFMKYVRQIKFDANPNYKKILGMFEDSMKELEIDISDGIFDWHIQKELIIE